jgi:hypothetical protein
MSRPLSGQDPADLRPRLRARQPELEQAVLARVRAIVDSSAAPDSGYLQGLRTALVVAVDYGLSAIECPQRDTEPVPVELLAQARLAARNGVSLDVVVRRYTAGHVLLTEAFLEEAAALGVSMAGLTALLRALTTRFERVIAAVGKEYKSEQRSRPADSSEQRRIRSIERLLAGERLGFGDLGYNLGGWHLGAVASGVGEGPLSEIATALDRNLLAIDRGDGTIWAWLGGRRHFEPPELDVLASLDLPSQAAIAYGEPGQGLAGWRLTHRQATVALDVAKYGADKPVRYADVALLATVIQDEILTQFLRWRYLVPLESGRDRGAAAKRTLHAYFAAGGNTSSAAAALGVSRNTVASRLQAIEAKLGGSLDSCGTDLNAALQMDLLDDRTDSPAWQLAEHPAANRAH